MSIIPQTPVPFLYIDIRYLIYNELVEGHTNQIANHTDQSPINALATTFSTLQTEINIYYARKNKFEHDSVYGFFDPRMVPLSFEMQEKFPRTQTQLCSEYLADGTSLHDCMEAAHAIDDG